ncbi:hypothetical protein CTA1_11941 [Colletotrichum tanaceti]|uniref:Uncharacterized protein n=1 Tax=Colletotrichum tanaceti TaxID=1306861 RepID=A0A4U6XKZ1_9PEZI|nr:hypothetical protein CTA1_11941 [Colletotrichum tanaceti]
MTELVGAVAHVDVVDGELGEVVAVGAREHGVEVHQAVHHGDGVVLDVAEVQRDVHVRRDLVVLGAPLGEGPEHVGLAAEQAHEAHDVLARVADGAEEGLVVLDAGDEDLVLDGVGLVLDLVDGRAERVDNRHLLLELGDAEADPRGVQVGGEAEADDALLEDDGVDVEGVVVGLAALLLDDDEGAEAGEVVGREELDLLAALLVDDVLDGEGVDAKGLADGPDLAAARAVHVEPPDAVRVARGEVEQGPDVLFRQDEVAELGGVDGRLQRGGEEVEAALLALVDGPEPRRRLRWRRRAVDRGLFLARVRSRLGRRHVDVVPAGSEHGRDGRDGAVGEVAKVGVREEAVAVLRVDQGLEALKVDVEPVPRVLALVAGLLPRELDRGDPVGGATTPKTGDVQPANDTMGRTAAAAAAAAALLRAPAVFLLVVRVARLARLLPAARSRVVHVSLLSASAGVGEGLDGVGGGHRPTGRLDGGTPAQGQHDGGFEVSAARAGGFELSGGHVGRQPRGVPGPFDIGMVVCLARHGDDGGFAMNPQSGEVSRV